MARSIGRLIGFRSSKNSSLSGSIGSWTSSKKSSSLSGSIGFCSSKNSSLSGSIGFCSSKNSSLSGSIGSCTSSKNSPLARLIGSCTSSKKSVSLSGSIGFCSSKNSSLARSIGFGFGFSKRNSVISSSSLILCPSSSVSVPTPTPTRRLPWLMLAPDKKNTSVHKFYALSEKDVKEVVVESDHPPPNADSLCFGMPCKGWITYVREKDCQFYLFNPLSGQKINLPPVETLPSVTGVIRNSQTGLVERFISKHCNTKPVTPRSLAKSIIADIVLSSSPLDDDCIAVVIYRPRGKLAFCRIRDDPSCWIPLKSPYIQYHQIVYHSGKKLFYTLSSFNRRLEAWDLHNDPIKRFDIKDQSKELERIHTWPPCTNDENKDFVLAWKNSRFWAIHDYLVYDHQSQELFVVLRHTYDRLHVHYIYGIPLVENPLDYMTITFDVFKVDFINHDLMNLRYLEDSIGSRAIFLGKNRGFALSTAEFPELRPGSIYFADDRYDWRYNFGGHDMGIYDYEEDSIIEKKPSISPSQSWFIPDVDAPDVDANF